MMPQPRRKKWTEAEERTLIDKYGEMLCSGTLAKMKSREKKYRPIALYVNSVHHARNPVAFPWQWSWKDVSTKVQNMRHQYALVKQKIKTIDSVEDLAQDEFDWMEGLTHWSNFLRYKEVFGDVETVFNSNESMAVVGDGDDHGGGFDGSGNGMEIVQFGNFSREGDGDFAAGIDGVENGVIGLEFDYDAEEGEENQDGSNKSNDRSKDGEDDGFAYEDIDRTGSDARKKRKVSKSLEKKPFGFLANQLVQLREMEARFEQREAERERERQRREHVQMEIEQERERKLEERVKEREEREKNRAKLRQQMVQEWEAMENDGKERERRRRDEELIYQKEWEEMINKRRSEWKKRIDGMLSEHHIEMSQIQTRILHEQQNLTSQLLGMFSQWTAHPNGLPDHTGTSSHYISQMMNLHHVNDMVHEDERVDGDNHEDQFIVDG